MIDADGDRAAGDPDDVGDVRVVDRVEGNDGRIAVDVDEDQAEVHGRDEEVIAVGGLARRGAAQTLGVVGGADRPVEAAEHAEVNERIVTGGGSEGTLQGLGARDLVTGRRGLEEQAAVVRRAALLARVVARAVGVG